MFGGGGGHSRARTVDKKTAMANEGFCSSEIVLPFHSL